MFSDIQSTALNARAVSDAVDKQKKLSRTTL